MTLLCPDVGFAGILSFGTYTPLRLVPAQFPAYRTFTDPDQNGDRCLIYSRLYKGAYLISLLQIELVELLCHVLITKVVFPVLLLRGRNETKA